MVFIVVFDINHQCPGSGVQFCPRDSSDHSLTLTQQNRPLHQYFTRRALTGHEAVIARKKIKNKKNLQAVMLLEVSLTTLLSLWASKGQNLRVGFFSWRKRENCVDFGVALVSLHHRSEGSSDFYMAYGWRFDFSCVLSTLMSTLCNFPSQKEGCDMSGGYAQCLLYFSHTLHSVLRH